MLNKFLKEVLLLVVGRQAEGMGDLLYSNKHVNEFLIAKKLGITINQTRNILYKIADKGLVSSIRKKDKRKGWYTYFWKIEVLKALDFYKEHVLKKIEQIHNQIRSRELKQFYLCEKCNLEFNEENALLYDFTCRECGDVFVLKDNTKVIKDFKKELVRFEAELKDIDEEIEKEKAKLEKARVKEVKKKMKEKLIKNKAKSKKVKKKVGLNVVGLKKKKKPKIKKSKKLKKKTKKSSKKPKKNKARLSVAGLRTKAKKIKKPKRKKRR